MCIIEQSNSRVGLAIMAPRKFISFNYWISMELVGNSETKTTYRIFRILLLSITVHELQEK